MHRFLRRPILIRRHLGRSQTHVRTTNMTVFETLYGMRRPTSCRCNFRILHYSISTGGSGSQGPRSNHLGQPYRYVRGIRADWRSTEQRCYITELRWRRPGILEAWGGAPPPRGPVFLERCTGKARQPWVNPRPQRIIDGTPMPPRSSFQPDESANDGTPEDATDRESINEAHDACVLEAYLQCPSGLAQMVTSALG